MRVECLHDVDINWIIFVYFVVRHRRARQTRGSVLFCTKLQIHITSVSENGGKAQVLEKCVYNQCLSGQKF